MGVAGREAAGRGSPLPAWRGGGKVGGCAVFGYAQGGWSSMAEDESDQESERLSEELEALVTPGPPAGLPALLNSQYYCRRFCQVSAAFPPPPPFPHRWGPPPPRGVGKGDAAGTGPLPPQPVAGWGVGPLAGGLGSVAG